MGKENKSIFASLKLDAKQEEKVKQMDKMQMELELEDDKQLSEYEQNVENILEGKQDVDIEHLSKLDQGIERGKQFKAEITDLTESLTREFQELGQSLLKPVCFL